MRRPTENRVRNLHHMARVYLNRSDFRFRKIGTASVLVSLRYIDGGDRTWALETSNNKTNPIQRPNSLKCIKYIRPLARLYPRRATSDMHLICCADGEMKVSEWRVLCPIHNKIANHLFVLKLI